MTLCTWASVVACAALFATLAGEAVETLRAWLRYRRVKADAEAAMSEAVSRSIRASTDVVDRGKDAPN